MAGRYGVERWDEGKVESLGRDVVGGAVSPWLRRDGLGEARSGRHETSKGGGQEDGGEGGCGLDGGLVEVCGADEMSRRL